MSIFDSLFGNNATTTESQASLSGPAAGVATNLFNAATNYANQPYSAYGGPRVAGFTPSQDWAVANTKNIATSGGNLFNQLAGATQASIAGRPTDTVRGLAADSAGLATAGNQAISGLAGLFPDADIARYMNPYTDAVLDPALADIARRSATQATDLRSNAVRTGSFGGSRNALAQQELERNTMGEMGRLSANERAKAFTEAADQYRKDQAAIPALYAAGQALNRGGIEQAGQAAGYEAQGLGLIQSLLGQNAARLSSEVNPLLATGGLEQALNQANIDASYGDFREQRDWGARGIDALRNALGVGGPATGATSSTTQTSPTGNPIGQVIGATTGLLGSLGGVQGVANLANTAGNVISSGWNWLTGSGGGSGLTGYSAEIGGGGNGLAGITDFGSW